MPRRSLDLNCQSHISPTRHTPDLNEFQWHETQFLGADVVRPAALPSPLLRKTGTNTLSPSICGASCFLADARVSRNAIRGATRVVDVWQPRSGTTGVWVCIDVTVIDGCRSRRRGRLAAVAISFTPRARRFASTMGNERWITRNCGECRAKHSTIDMVVVRKIRKRRRPFDDTYGFRSSCCLAGFLLRVGFARHHHFRRQRDLHFQKIGACELRSQCGNIRRVCRKTAADLVAMARAIVLHPQCAPDAIGNTGTAAESAARAIGSFQFVYDRPWSCGRRGSARSRRTRTWHHRHNSGRRSGGCGALLWRA